MATHWHVLGSWLQSLSPSLHIAPSSQSPTSTVRCKWLSVDDKCWLSNCVEKKRNERVEGGREGISFSA